MKLALAGLLIACGPATPPPQAVELPHTASGTPKLEATSSAPDTPSLPPPRVTSEMASLAKQRVEVAKAYATLSQAMYEHGSINSAAYFDAQREVFLAERDSGLKGAELVAAARAYRDVALTASQRVEQSYKNGSASQADVQLAKLRSLEASYWLAQASAE